MGNCFKPIIRDLEQDFKNITIIVIDWLNIPVLPQSDYFENKEDHAGEVETSAMLYFHPELVNMQQAGNGDYKNFNIEGLKNKTGWTPRNWNKISTDTGVGNPKEATNIKGEIYIEDITDEISKLIKEFCHKYNNHIYDE
jgi:creatinine amidohydrolase